MMLGLAADVAAAQGPTPRPFGVPGSGGLGGCLPAAQPGRPVPKELLAMANASPAKVRIVRLGDRITMDFIPDRLTIVVDRNGNLVSSRCG